MDSSRRCRFLDFPAHFALFLAPRQALISGESSSRFAGSEAVRLKPGESRNHEGNLSAGSSTNLRAALCREWKNRSTPKRQFPSQPASPRPTCSEKTTEFMGKREDQGRGDVLESRADFRPDDEHEECVKIGCDRIVDGAWFNFSIFADDKSWVAGVELATASGPQRGSLGSGGVAPSHPEV